jgi:hypothetical protein
MAASGRATIGEPIGSSLITTVQLAVPPRISGPYDGYQVVCSPASRAACASSWPAKSTPWPPKPAMIRSLFTPCPPLGVSARLGHLEVAERERRHHLVADEGERGLGCHAPVGGAAREQLDHREAEALRAGPRGAADRLLGARIWTTSCRLRRTT